MTAPALAPRFSYALLACAGLSWAGDRAHVPDRIKPGIPAHKAWTSDPLRVMDSLTRFSLDSLEIISSAPLPGLAEDLRVFQGRAATPENMADLRAATGLALSRHGFPFAEFTLQPVEMPAGSARPPHSLIVRLHIQAGEGYKLGGWLARQTRTRPDILLRLSALSYGETFDEGRVSLAMARLRRLGYFASVDSLGLIRDKYRNLIYPYVRIADEKANRIGGLLGYDSDAERNGLSGYIDVHLVNIRGTARDFDFTFESRPQGMGRSDREASLKYLEPWLPGLPLGLRVEGRVWLQDSVYEQLDGSLALLQDLDFHSRLEVTLSRQWSRDYILAQESEAYAGGLGFLYDGRDRFPFTLRGGRVDAKVNGVRRVLGDSSRYLLQPKVFMEGYRGVFSRLLARARLEGGMVWPRRPAVLRGDRFEVGGARSLRGYREREFSTDAYAYGDLELQWLADNRSRLMLFASPGLVNRLGGDPADLWWHRLLGYGVGMELGSPSWAIGLLYALNPRRSLGNGLLHVTVENRF